MYWIMTNELVLSTYSTFFRSNGMMLATVFSAAFGMQMLVYSSSTYLLTHPSPRSQARGRTMSERIMEGPTWNMGCGIWGVADFAL